MRGSGLWFLGSRDHAAMRVGPRDFRWRGAEVLEDFRRFMHVIGGKTGFLHQVGLPEAMASENVPGGTLAGSGQSQARNRLPFHEARPASAIDGGWVRDSQAIRS